MSTQIKWLSDLALSSVPGKWTKQKSEAKKKKKVVNRFQENAKRQIKSSCVLLAAVALDFSAPAFNW